MLRVAIDVSIQGRAAPTGVERAQATLLDGLLHRSGFEFILLSPRDVPSRWSDLPQVSVPKLRSGLPLWLWRETVMARALRTCGAQLLHSPVAAMPWFSPCPVMVTLHELPWAEPGTPGDTRPAHRVRTAVAAARARRIVCVSTRTRQHLLSLHRGAAERAVVVPHAVDPLFGPHVTSGVDRAGLLKPLGLSDGPFVLGVGRLTAKKNFGLLMDALAAPGLRDVRLVLAGPPGPARAALRHRARRADLRGRVALAGHLPDDTLAALYGQAACLAVPSHFEGFGLTVLEAYSCGTPVVASLTGAVPEVTGDAALLCDANDAAALAASLEAVVHDPVRAADLATRGRAHAARFTVAAQVARVCDLYRDATA